MNELKNILIQNNYIEKNHVFIKHKKDYTAQIELNDIDEIFVNFVLKRLYKNKAFELINQKRRKVKFINNIQKIINNEVNLKSKELKGLLKIDIYCWCCEKTIIKNIDNCSLKNIYGYIDQYPSQGGICISTIDEESRQKVFNELEKIKNCPDCRIDQF